MEETTTPVVQAKRDLSPFYIPAAIVVAGVIIGASVFASLGGAGGLAAQDGKPAAVKVNVKDIPVDDEPYIGNKSAKVVLVEWTDFQCPFCRAVEVGHPQIPIEPAMPLLIKNYVEKGLLKIVYKDYPFLGEDSKTAALYGRAVWNLYPDKYHQWREAMYTAQDEEGDKGFGDEASIIALMKKIPGIDTDAVKADVAAHGDAYQKSIDTDRAEGTSFGVNGTPGFITGKTLIPGAVGYDELKKAIDEQL